MFAFAAVADMRVCNEEEALANKINDPTEFMAALSALSKPPLLIHFSTGLSLLSLFLQTPSSSVTSCSPSVSDADMVFSGEKAPYSDDDKCEPKNMSHRI